MQRLIRVPLSFILCAILLVSSAAAGIGLAGQARADTASLVQTASSQMLVTGQGMTLYLLTADKKNQSNCNGGCAKAWPPLIVPTGTTAPTSLAGFSGSFATTKRADGTIQLTYDGAPLYTFAKDANPGDINGQGVGGVWWIVVAPTAAKSTAPAAAPATSLVKTAPAQILVTAQGMALYVYAPDKKNQSVCYTTCAKFWPPLLVPSGTALPTVETNLSLTFAPAKRSNQTVQCAFGGAPLYTFLNDKKAGDINGQGVQGIWWAVVVAAGSPAALVKTSPAQILVNSAGMTLYLYTPDKKNQSNCTGDCAKFWPPVTVPTGTTVPASMTGVPGVFATTTRTDGTTQLTYDGAPLYTFVKDTKPGDMSGQGVAGTWWIVVVPAAQS